MAGIVKSLRALVVDDEPLARELLIRMLAEDGAVEVIGQAGDGHAAARAIAEMAPDVVFLDIQMPEMDGFDVLRALPAERMPLIVFVTAHDEFAVQAFDVHAADYVLKPYDAPRIRRALTRVRATLGNRPALDGEQIAALLSLLRRRETHPERLAVRKDGRVTFVDVADIAWAEAADKIVRLHAGQEIHELRASMAALERLLDPAKFFRIHRSIIVQARQVREVQPWFQNDYVVILRDGTRLQSGRAYRANLQRLIADAAQP